mmetsp:Transcript_7596/g.15816  ORF Transcript_7596/g.15816 Transcript_7596/m.15816 type:complete len:220 (+) Transcript_7596:576-1235(+)
MMIGNPVSSSKNVVTSMAKAMFNQATVGSLMRSCLTSLITSSLPVFSSSFAMASLVSLGLKRFENCMRILKRRRGGRGGQLSDVADSSSEDSDCRSLRATSLGESWLLPPPGELLCLELFFSDQMSSWLLPPPGELRCLDPLFSDMSSSSNWSVSSSSLQAMASAPMLPASAISAPDMRSLDPALAGAGCSNDSACPPCDEQLACDLDDSCGSSPRMLP